MEGAKRRRWEGGSGDHGGDGNGGGELTRGGAGGARGVRQQGRGRRFARSPRVPSCLVHLRGACEPPPAPVGRVRTAPDRPSRAQAGRQADTGGSHRQQGRGRRFARSPRVLSCLVHLRGACEPPPAPVGRVRTAPDRPSRAQAGRTRAVRTGSKGARCHWTG